MRDDHLNENAAARPGRRIEVRGVVQGVGFRPWVYRLAHEHGLTGRVWNHAQGVSIEAFGEPGALARFLAGLERDAPPAARIDALSIEALDGVPPSAFTIERSGAAEQVEVSIPPDLATCAACFSEIADPAGRRHRYAFTNCTDCGPRYSIAADLPYDRPATTMAAFEMCGACRAEYESPLDRRFHAQPIACPDCGPRLRLLSPAGDLVDAADPLTAAAGEIRNGGIVAVKGLGGYLLACDATSPAAVATLRARKRREQKPFAVMVSTLADAERLATLTPDERALLASPESPIVLCRAREDSPVTPAVAPGSPLVGLFLAYTPLHRLLLEGAGVPLVMTSGNLSEEPLAYRDEQAVERLGPMVEALLAHDRPIAAPCDDSVAQVVNGAPMLFRRARGYVPRAIALARPVPRPILACGALLKNTFCLAEGSRAWLGPHVGDLDNLATIEFFEDGIERLSRFTRVRPEVFAHDLHPDLHSTRYAMARGRDDAVAVQHHHAHVAAVMAEHRLDGPVIGIAYDGTGYGSDGASWGGEILLADVRGFTRAATFRPIGLAGGDVATVHVWRLALALVLDAFGVDDAPIDRLPVLAGRPAAEVAIVRQMLATGLNTPAAHGVGRYFDAFGALGLSAPRAHYEGQVAIAWNHAAADPGDATPWPFELDANTEPLQIDLRPATRAFVGAFLHGDSVRVLSARFHQTVIAATVTAISRVAAAHGPLPVALGGGCFQNALLTEGLVRALSPRHAVHVPREVPPGDGGISLGQVLVAAAATSS